MALVVLNAGREPLGQFDGLDSQLTSFKGGEVCTLVGAAVPGTDLAAADSINDGYVGTTSKFRPVVTSTLTSTSSPLYLSDDGVAHYGTLFGQVVCGTAGQILNGTVLGPSSATGSGKITCWDKQGLYGVTLDAVDTVSLTPSNATLSVGSKLTYTAAGLLTAVGSAAAVGSAPVCATLVSFENDGGLVNTKASMVSALNSPSGSVATINPQGFYMAVINWRGGL